MTTYRMGDAMNRKKKDEMEAAELRRLMEPTGARRRAGGAAALEVEVDRVTACAACGLDLAREVVSATIPGTAERLCRRCGVAIGTATVMSRFRK